MDRDYQFEMTYLLSLTVATLAVITIENVRVIVDIRIAYFLLFFVSIHTVLFNFFYTFENIGLFRNRMASAVKNRTQYSLFFITVCFLYLVFHVVGGFLGELLSFCNQPSSSIFVSLISVSEPCTLGIMFMRYGSPTLLVGLAMIPLWKRIVPALRLRKIDISIQPDDIRIFSTYEHTEPLFINVSNNSAKMETFDIRISFPESVCWKTNKEHCSEDFQKTADIESGQREPLNLQLRYKGDESKTERILVELEHNYGVFTNDVQVSLYPQ